MVGEGRLRSESTYFCLKINNLDILRRCDDVFLELCGQFHKIPCSILDPTFRKDALQCGSNLKLQILFFFVSTSNNTKNKVEKGNVLSKSIGNR